MKTAKWLLLPLILCLCGPVSAEFYKYTDQNGHVRFTDDLSKVPENQRPDATSYEESQSTPQPPPSSTAKPEKTKGALERRPKSNIRIESQGKKIEMKKKELDQEYQALMKEGAHLEEERKNLKSQSQIKAYHRKIEAHNDKIYQWEEKQKAYNAEVESHNARLADKARRAKDKK